jgi:hypothetical protein
VFGVVRDSPHPGGHHRGARGDDWSNFLSGLLETDAIALHRICFEPHNPHPVCDHLLPFPRAKDCEAREKRSRVFRYALSVF